MRPSSSDQLSRLRHSLAHLLAAAVQELYPHAQPTLGPAIDTGFYYDFDFTAGEKPGPDDLPRIEKKMRELLPTWSGFTESKVSAKEAREHFANNPYKLELIDELEQNGEQITFYSSGPAGSEFTDLCRGDHIENPGDLDPRAFTLTSIAGAYWRGNEENPMLTRIYGAAFASPEELKAHQDQLAEAAKRDHRKLGKELNLFTTSDLVGQGLPLFTPKGTILRDVLAQYLEKLNKAKGYEMVWIPHLTKRALYETSGHIEKFGDDLFKVYGARQEEFILKPMNCPHHTQIYASTPRSYRDLPIRFTETTTVYRDEQAGELHGLSRVRSLTQDDGHVFCAPEQIEEEIKRIIGVIEEFYTSLEMYNQGDFRVTLSVHDPDKPDNYLGDPKRWNEVVSDLEKIANNADLPYEKDVGEAAFYGPKLDYKFKDAIGREWQLATIQLDFLMPERFGLEYTDKDGSKKTPVMIHRAITGSLERFLAILIEHFAGTFPAWLAPVQTQIIPVASDSHGQYAREVAAELNEAGIRVEVSDGDDSLGKRIRQAKIEKVPYLLVLGDTERQNQTVKVESRDEGDIGELTISEFLHRKTRP